MRNRYGLGGIARAAVLAVVALAITTPASAQFGGLKKKLKGAAAQEGASKAAGAAGVTPETPADAADAGGPAGAGGGTIVLTEDVVGQLIAGLKAGQAARAAASKEDSPYGRYRKAEAAYAEAQPKCQAAQQTFPQRMSGNEKAMDKYSALVDKMVAAQGKGDQKLMAIYQDSAMAMQDPSCVVKQPTQPDDYYQAQRDIDSRAEQQEIKASGFSRSELAMVKERADAILRGATPPGDASPAEKSAVSAKAGELKPLLGIHDQPAARATKPAPAPAPTPAPAPAAPSAPAMSPAASSMNACMMNNLQTHQADIEALGKRAEAAKAANDTGKMMAIVDTLQQIQMAGCRGQ
jgi:hypothetical protein